MVSIKRVLILLGVVLAVTICGANARVLTPSEKTVQKYMPLPLLEFARGAIDPSSLNMVAQVLSKKDGEMKIFKDKIFQDKNKNFLPSDVLEDAMGLLNIRNPVVYGVIKIIITSFLALAILGFVYTIISTIYVTVTKKGHHN
eukprot:Nk52_evm8s914 gene=Nk52_evmTU8s914